MASDTDVDVSIVMAVGTWVACCSVDQATTCHLTSDSLVLAANETTFSITGVSWVPDVTITAHDSRLGTRAAVTVSLVRRVDTRTSRLPTDNRAALGGAEAIPP